MKKFKWFDIQCALTHNLETCEHCKQCGNDVAKLRLEMAEQVKQEMQELESIKGDYMSYKDMKSELDKLEKKVKSNENYIKILKKGIAIYEKALDIACEELSRKEKLLSSMNCSTSLPIDKCWSANEWKENLLKESEKQ